MASQLLPAGAGPGFDVTVGWANDALTADVGGKPSAWFAVDRQFGPLDVDRVGVEVRDGDALAVLLDGSLSLAGVRLQPDGLGIVVPLPSLLAPDEWDFTIRGLGLSYDQGGVSVSGLLRNSGGDFQGAALVRAFGYQLGAIGAYTALVDPRRRRAARRSSCSRRSPRRSAGRPGSSSPAWPAASATTARSRCPTASRAWQAAVLRPDEGRLGPEPDRGRRRRARRVPHAAAGTLWLAGGVMFTSFALIKGQALLYVVIGPHFELGLMALCGSRCRRS
jgi:hypothetical protein